MWPTVPILGRRVTGGSGTASASTASASTASASTASASTASASTASAGPAMATLRSMIAYLASMIRCVGIAYIVIQVGLWHSFYAHSAWRLTAPVLAVAWAMTVAVHLRRHPPSPRFACLDSACYVGLALGAQACVPPAVRDGASSWLVIAMSGQLIVPGWCAPRRLSEVLVLASPVAYWVGAAVEPVTDVRMMTGAAILLLVVGLMHEWGRRVLYGRAAASDADVDRADRAAREQYAILCRNIERREHERLVHDTVLNTLTAVARAGSGAKAELVTRCRQDVGLIEATLGGVGDPAPEGPAPEGPAPEGPVREGPVREGPVGEGPVGEGPVPEGRAADDPAPDDPAPDDPAAGAQTGNLLLTEIRAVVADMRARGLTVHLQGDEAAAPAVPAPVAVAISSAVREALSNVAAHAGTGEAWVRVDPAAPEDERRLRVVVRDQGTGFDQARVDQSRLGLRRSISERATECGGHASICSAPGQGTEVSLTWPAPGTAGDAPAGDGFARQGPP